MSNIEYRITYCGAWGYKQRAVRLAAELENKLDASAQILQSSGGVFEVEQNGQLIFSKKALHRFPEDGEILRIIWGLEHGKSLEEAQKEAAPDIKPQPSFFQWLESKFKMSRK